MQFLHSPFELREVDREREDMAAGRKWTASVEETGPGAAKDSGGGRCLEASSTLEDDPSGGSWRGAGRGPGDRNGHHKMTGVSGGRIVILENNRTGECLRGLLTSKDREKAVSFE